MLQSLIARAAIVSAFAVASLSGCIVVKDGGDNNRHTGGGGGGGGGRTSSPPPEEHHEAPRGGKYSSLPNMGYLDNYLPQGFRGECMLKPGRYALRDNKLKIGGGDLTILGAGLGNTVIDGDLTLVGNGFVVKQFTVNGDFELRGNNCTIEIHIEGAKNIKGGNNQGGNIRGSYEPDADAVAAQPTKPAPQPAQPKGKHGLPDMGYLDQYLPEGMRGECFLKPGIYKLRGGRFKHGGGGLTIQGAGKGQTIIEGDIILHGDAYTFMGLTVTGDVELHGHNSTGDIQIQGHKDIRGANNRGW